LTSTESSLTSTKDSFTQTDPCLCFSFDNLENISGKIGKFMIEEFRRLRGENREFFEPLTKSVLITPEEKSSAKDDISLPENAYSGTGTFSMMDFSTRGHVKSSSQDFAASVYQLSEKINALTEKFHTIELQSSVVEAPRFVIVM